MRQHCKRNVTLSLSLVAVLNLKIIFACESNLCKQNKLEMSAKTGGDEDPQTEEHAGVVREVGSQAVWSLSSCKPGNMQYNKFYEQNTQNIPIHLGFGVEQLRDNCMDTYWQSDGQLPHLVNIQFQRKTTINQIYIYTDYKLDESYTPSRISIRSGTHFNDLQEIEIIDLCEPTGK